MRTYNERSNNRQSYYGDRGEGAPSRGQPYGNGRAKYEDGERPRYQSERESDTAPNMDFTEWTLAERIRVKHITVSIWERQGKNGRPVYSLTLTRSFRSQPSQTSVSYGCR